MKAISDSIILTSKEDVLKLHLTIKLTQMGKHFTKSDLLILALLHDFGGYSSSDEQALFLDHCLSRGVKESKQSIRNSLSRLVKSGILIKPRNSMIKINEDILPSSVSNINQLFILYRITHADGLK